MSVADIDRSPRLKVLYCSYMIPANPWKRTLTLKAAYVTMMLGLGDTIYQRPSIVELSRRIEKVFVATSWPELFCDLPNVYPVKPKVDLRVQLENVKRWTRWYEPPLDCK